MKSTLHAGEVGRGAMLALGFAVAVTAGVTSATVVDMDVQTRNISFGEIAPVPPDPEPQPAIDIHLEDDAWRVEAATDVMPGDSIPLAPRVVVDEVNTPAFYFMAVGVPIVDGKEIFTINPETYSRAAYVPGNEDDAMDFSGWQEVLVEKYWGTNGELAGHIHVFACLYNWNGASKFATRMTVPGGPMKSLTYDPDATVKIPDQKVEVRAYALQADGLDDSFDPDNVQSLWKLAKSLAPSREVYAF